MQPMPTGAERASVDQAQPMVVVPKGSKNYAEKEIWRCWQQHYRPQRGSPARGIVKLRAHPSRILSHYGYDKGRRKATSLCS